jgi:hypothetical protein
MGTSIVLCIVVCAQTVTAQIVPPTGGGGSFLTCTSGSPYDRFYQFGDDSAENGTVGSPVGDPTFGLTLDSIGTPFAGDFNDLDPFGGPVYADTSSQPFGSPGDVGIRFDGVNDYLVGENLNWPRASRSSIDYVDDDTNPLPGPCNYRGPGDGIVNRTLQFWVRPNASGLGNGLVQSLVVDSNEHGVLISASDTWVLRYDDVDVDSGVTVDTNWHHVQVSRPFGPAGLSGGARLWVDGVAIAAEPGDYSGSRVDLVVGANTANDASGNFTGGTAQFFAGDMDRLFMSVHGDSSSNTGPPPGQDYGDFNFATDNDFATDFLSGVEGDVNNDGNFDETDRSAYINGWMVENLVNDLRSGDINSLGNGDLNFDGINDINDLVRFQQALVAAGMRPISPDELVPEPGCCLLSICGLAAALTLRRRYRA